jgi:hypothetical protein
LWTSGDGLAWLTSQALEKARVPVNTKVAQAIDQALLATLLHYSPTPTLSLDLAENQKRHDAEVERRRANGVPVGEAPVPTQRPRIRMPRKKANSTEIKVECADEPVPVSSPYPRLLLR